MTYEHQLLIMAILSNIFTFYICTRKPIYSGIISWKCAKHNSVDDKHTMKCGIHNGKRIAAEITNIEKNYECKCDEL